MNCALFVKLPLKSSRHTCMSSSGIVVAVTSGDSFICKLNKGNDGVRGSYVLVEFAEIIAPKTFIKSNSEDEKYAMECCRELRKIIQGQRIILTNETQTKRTFNHPILERIDVIECHVKLFDQHDFDIALYMLKNGWATHKNLHGTANIKYINAQQNAEQKKVGIFSGVNPSGPYSSDFMKHTGQECILTNVSGFTGYFPGLDILNPVQFTIAGITIPHYTTDFSRDQSKIQTLVDDCIYQPLCMRALGRSNQSSNHYIFAANYRDHDYAIFLLENGIARIDPLTINYIPNQKHHYQAELRAQLNIPTLYNQPFTNVHQQFQAKCLYSNAAGSLTISVNNKKVVLRLQSIRAPKFNFSSDSEPFGYESWQYLNQIASGKIITVIPCDFPEIDVIVGYAYLDDIFLNRDLVETGYAHFVRTCVYLPEDDSYPVDLDSISTAYKLAKQNGIGMFSSGCC